MTSSSTIANHRKFWTAQLQNCTCAMAKSLILLAYNLNLLYLGLKMLDRGPKLKKIKWCASVKYCAE